MLKEEYEYFTNQLYKEMKRMNMLHYEESREGFVDMGEIMMKSIYDVRHIMSLMWVSVDEY